MTTDTLKTFKVKGSKVKVTTSRNVSAVKHYKSGTDRSTEFKLSKNYRSAKALK